MRRNLLLGLAAAGIAAVGVAGGVAGASLLDDDEVELAPITVAAQTSDVSTGTDAGSAAAAGSSAIVAEDGIAAADARRLAAAATEELPGAAISVEADDGLFNVEVRDRAGAIVEVLVDQSGRVVGMDRGDD
ncbi:MAG TPA: hypothetical protein VIL49_17845 [Capillimicrobium sp.]|jgi:hypothetical protein